MPVYWFIFIWTVVVGWVYHQRNDMLADEDSDTMVSYRYMLLTFLPLLFFAIFRTYVIDTAAYIDYFIHTPDDLSQFAQYVDARKDSQLFYGLQMLFKVFISSNPTVWIGLIAVVEGLLVANFFRRYSDDFAMSAYIFIASTQFVWMYNGIRQFLVVSILLALTHWILENRWKSYCLVVLILCGIDPLVKMFTQAEPAWFMCGIHQSGLIMIPIFFLAQGEAFNKRVWLLIAIVVFMAVAGNIGGAIESLSENTAYADDIANMQKDEGSSPIRVLVATIPVILAWIRRNDPEFVNAPDIIHLSVNLSIVAAVLYFVAMLTSGIYVGRLPIYCELYGLILMPWLLKHLYYDVGWLTPAVYIFYLIYFLYQMYVAWAPGLAYVSRTLGIFYWGHG